MVSFDPECYSKKAVQDVLDTGKVCLLDIDMQVSNLPNNNKKL